jgi:allantoinase
MPPVRQLPDLVIRSRRVVLGDEVRPASVHVASGRIAGVHDEQDVPAGARVLEAGDRVVMPGLVDTHVHINDPGRADWEGFEHATRAAAAGGVTTLVDMPLNSVPPTTAIGGLDAKQRAAQGRLRVDVGFWGGLVPGNASELEPLIRAGVAGFKCFLVPSGVEEFPPVGDAEIGAALPVLARHGVPLLVHAEDRTIIERAEALAWPEPESARRYDAYLRSRPGEAELAAVRRLIDLARPTGASIHIVHVSCAATAALVRAAADQGLPMTAETCPHYLSLRAEDVPDGATEFKCAPPIRTQENQDGLWAALRRGEVQMIVSDHSPAPAAMKCCASGDFRHAWGGIASLQIGLPAVWTAARGRGHTVQDLAEWMCRGPATLARLEGRKGSLRPGRDADVVIWDPDARFVVRPADLHHRHPVTPYAGRTLQGRVETTLLRGRIIYDRGAFPAAPQGEVLALPLGP